MCIRDSGKLSLKPATSHFKKTGGDLLVRETEQVATDALLTTENVLVKPISNSTLTCLLYTSRCV